MNRGNSLPADVVYQNMKAGLYNGDTRRLFRDLRNGIIGDYEVRGKCEYVERFFKSDFKYRIRLVEISALRDVGAYYLKKERLTDPFQTDYLPRCEYQYYFSRQPYPWEDGMDEQPVPQDVLSIAHQIDNQQTRLWREQQNAAAQQKGGVTMIPITENRPSVPQRDSEGGVTARQNEDAGRTKAREKENQILDKARNEASRILREAEEEAARIRAEAIKERSEAQQLLQHNRERAGQLEQERKSMEEQETHLDAIVKEKTGQLAARYLRDYQADLRNQWNLETAEELREDMEAVRQLNEAKAALCDTTNDLKVTWRKNLEETIEDMKTLQRDLDDRLRSWQSALYPREFRPIADCYVQLYRILTQDQLLTSEILAQPGEVSAEALSETPSPDQVADSERPAADQRLHPETLQSLKKLNTSLQTFLKKFEKALIKLGLSVYTPQPGERFDDVMHTAAEEEDDPYSKVVSRCFVPGVVRQSGGGLEDADPVIRAVVGLKDPEVN